MTTDSIVEKATIAVLTLFLGGAYVHYRKEPRLVKLEHAMWGTESNDGLASRSRHTEEAVAAIERRQAAHDGLLQTVANDVREIKDFIRSQRGTP